MKRISTLLIIIFLFLCGIGATQGNTQHQIDSVRRVISTQHGMEKVKSYKLLGSYLWSKATSEELIAYFEEFEKVILEEQKQEKNTQSVHDYISAYSVLKLNHSRAMCNYGNFEEAEKQARIGMDYCSKNEEWNYYYELYTMLLDAQKSARKYELMQRNAKKLYAEAKERNHATGMAYALYSLAEVYTDQARYAEAEESYRESIDLLNSMDFDEAHFLLVRSCTDLVTVLLSANKYDETLQALQKAEEVVERCEQFKAEKGQSAQIERFNLYFHYAEYYLRIKNYDKAEHYYRLLEEIAQTFGSERQAHINFYILRAEILEARGQYAEALTMTKKCEQIFNTIGGNPLGWAKIMFVKLRLLIRLGKAEESIALYDSLLIETDRVRDKEFNAQLDELRTVYEVDKITAEKELNHIEKIRNRNYFFFALGGCFLLAIALGIWIYYSRTIVKKNRGLYRQIKEQDRLADELEAMSKQYEQMAQLMPSADANVETRHATSLLPGNRQQRQLVSHLRDFLLKDRYFANYDIDIQGIIPKMATNRTSLFEALKAVTGKTPMEFINYLRLDEAKRLLDDSNLTIESIAVECGFNTARTLYRQFRERYRITPAEYRKFSVDSFQLTKNPI
ncbi:MAG: helix-turn-helix domain-containing protein [Bacteroidales bacterium]|jgi:AraC-like DNA-binding protein|nr:helix-turn-helix domain-containing protein [Bacteroidales bacterium]